MMLVPLAINDVFVTPMIVKSFFYVKSVTVLKSEGAVALLVCRTAQN